MSIRNVPDFGVEKGEHVQHRIGIIVNGSPSLWAKGSNRYPLHSVMPSSAKGAKLASGVTSYLPRRSLKSILKGRKTYSQSWPRAPEYYPWQTYHYERWTSENLSNALELARLADAAGLKHGEVRDKLICPTS